VNRLDRYIARLYLINVLALVLILSSFVVTIDVSVNFNRMVGRADQLLREQAGNLDPSLIRRGITTVLLIADLWWPRILQLFNYTIGLVMVGAMGFTFSQLVRGRELVAMLASGISLSRAARPVLLCAMLLSGVQLLNQETVIPRIAGLLTRDHGDAGKKELGLSDLPLMSDSAGRLFYARIFDADRAVIEDLLVIERENGGLATRRITARQAVWRDAGWDLSDGVELTTGAGTATTSTQRPVDRLESDLDPTTIKMRRFAGYSQSLSFRQLSRLIEQLPEDDSGSRDRLERFRWGRFAVIAGNILALAMTIPFFLRREPTNMLIQSLKCAPVAVIALMGGVLGATADVPGIPPQLGVLLPVLILTPLAIAAWAMVRT
jgi:lipopolysaccharide export system permease protein